MDGWAGDSTIKVSDLTSTLLDLSETLEDGYTRSRDLLNRAFEAAEYRLPPTVPAHLDRRHNEYVQGRIAERMPRTAKGLSDDMVISARPGSFSKVHFREVSVSSSEESCTSSTSDEQKGPGVPMLSDVAKSDISVEAKTSEDMTVVEVSNEAPPEIPRRDSLVTAVTLPGSLSDAMGCPFVKPTREKQLLVQLPRETSQVSERTARGPSFKSEARPRTIHELTTRRRGSQQVFASKECLKAQLMGNLEVPDYNVTQLYKTMGWCQAIARHTLFDHIGTFVIAANSIWIAVDTELNKAETLVDADLLFQVGENLFCVIFLTEWFFRFFSFQSKIMGCTDFWFVADTVLVWLMVFETWIMTVIILCFSGAGVASANTSSLRVLRIMRLSRVTRLVRIFRIVPELLVLCKGIAVSLKSVFYAFVMLLMVVFVFAISLNQVTGNLETDGTRFDSMPRTCIFLLVAGLAPDFSDFIIDEFPGDQAVLPILFFIFLIIATLCILNLLIGVLCDSVSTVACVEKERMDIAYVKSQFLLMLEEVDEDDNKQISQDEFISMLGIPLAAEALASVGVDVIDLVDFLDYFFADSQQISFGTFIETVLRLRGGNTASVRDVFDLRRMMGPQITKVEEALQDLDRRIMSIIQPGKSVEPSSRLLT